MTFYKGNAWQERQLEMKREDPKRYGCATREKYVVEMEAFRKLFAIQHNPDLSEDERALRSAVVMRESKKPQLLEKTPEQDFQDHLKAEDRFFGALKNGRPDLFAKYMKAKEAELDRWDRKLKPSEDAQKTRALEAKLQTAQEKLASHEDLHAIQKQTAKEQLAKAQTERKAEEVAYSILEREQHKDNIADMNLPERNNHAR